MKEPLSAIFSRYCFVFRFAFREVRASTTIKKSAGAHREECAPAVYYLTRLIFLSVFFAIFEK